ncbi:LysR family transcriptional regulator [Rubripirellula lacrimiformis]|uniref:LysR family transcriptional regulator n=1 Tax=Rubripirellula lacrimiformis TaxID=1930273 RepID=UPI0011A6F751|nr:LysR family transcriptional regulator [Rubripirellula lacrimiformis]
MHLRTLELFCTIAEQRSFSKAAEAHDLTQSAASQAIGHLEESLGVRLIDRSKRPLVLTPEGQTYLSGLRGVLRSYQRLEEEVRSISCTLRGRITIGTIVSVGLSYMPAATEAFARLHPEVDVMTEFGSADRVVEMTTEGEVDFGLVSFPKSTKRIQCIPWQQEPMRIVCSAEHPLAEKRQMTLDQLRGSDMIGFDRELILRQEIDRCLARAGVAVNVRMEFDNVDSMIRAIQANRGMGIIPEAAVRRETANGSLRVVACREWRMTRPLGMIFRRSGRLSRAANEFGSLLLGRAIESEIKSKSGSRKAAAESGSIEAGNGTSIVA